jgi:hypothetical protein
MLREARGLTIDYRRAVRIHVVLLALAACGGARDKPLANVGDGETTAPATKMCDRVAANIAEIPGPTDCCGVAGRRTIISRHCTEQRWPPSVEICAEPDGDRLACPAAAGLDEAQTHAWGELFELLHGGERCPC